MLSVQQSERQLVSNVSFSHTVVRLAKCFSVSCWSFLLGKVGLHVGLCLVATLRPPISGSVACAKEWAARRPALTALGSMVSRVEWCDILGLGLGELGGRPPLMELRLRGSENWGLLESCLWLFLRKLHRVGDVESFLVVGPKLGVLGSYRSPFGDI